jgi:AraC family transcriptional regulator
MEWVRSINLAIEYIEDHLDEDISCNEIAQNAFYSSFHFQRAFSLMTEMTIGEYIRNRRLSLAAQDLLNSNLKVVDVAIKFCYETPESFSKAFQRFHGVLPSKARAHGTDLKSFNRLTLKIILEGGSSMDYKIVQRDSFRVVAKTIRITCEKSGTEIPKFWSEYFSNGLGKKVEGMMGICAPKDPESYEFEYGIGCEEKYAKEIPEGFNVITIPAGTWAVFKCVGAMPDAMQNMWKRIYSEWLPQASYEMLPTYDMELYTDGDNSSSDYISEIWLPVIEKKVF